MPTGDSALNFDLTIADTSGLPFETDVEPVEVIIGEEMTWAMPEFDDSYELESIEVDLGELSEFVTFDENS